MNLATEYMGLKLRNPLVPSSSPLTQNIDSIKKLEDAGAAAIVLYSLFEEQIALESHQLDHHLNYFTDAFAESLDFFPDLGMYSSGTDEYLKLIREVKEQTDLPVIGSLNGVSVGGWIDYASKIAEAGADALELNIYYIPTDVTMSGAQVEEMYVQIVKAVRGAVDLPLTVKLSPYFSAPGNMMAQLAEAGANGLVLFNRFYQPDIDIEGLNVTPHLMLSTQFEMRLPLRWVAMLHSKVNVDFAITSGVHTYEDVLKSMMAGAKVTYLASELLRYGPERLTEIQDELIHWMSDHEYESIQQMQGSMSQQNVADPDAFERANYMKVLASWRSDPAGQGFKTLSQ